MPARQRRRRRLPVALAILALVAAAIGVIALGVPAGLPSELPSELLAGSPALGADETSLGDQDGYIATGDSISPFADDLPAIANLDPDLRAAMQSAAGDAEADGVVFTITSGWRSREYQSVLLEQAIEEYGSLDEASRWVASPDTSEHVTGSAVDVGYTDADSWLQQHGADYGLCQTYANEMWHFELRAAPGGECPAQLESASGR